MAEAAEHVRVSAKAHNADGHKLWSIGSNVSSVFATAGECKAIPGSVVVDDLL